MPLELQYARLRPRTFPLRRIVWFVGLMGAVLLGWQLQSCVRGRIAALAAHPYAGPIDWVRVAGSPSLLRLAWWLTSSPKNTRTFLKGENTPQGIVLFGAHPEDVTVNLLLPLRYADGQLCFSLEITNVSSKRVLLPPLRDLQSDLRDKLPDFLIISCSAERAWLSRATQVLEPGDSARFDFAATAPERPVQTDIRVATAGEANPDYFGDGANQFCLHILQFREVLARCKSWGDVSASMVESEVQPLHVEFKWATPIRR